MAWLELMGEPAATCKQYNTAGRWADLAISITIAGCNPLDSWGTCQLWFPRHLRAFCTLAHGQIFRSFFTGAGRLRLFPTRQALLLVNSVSSWFETHPCRVCSTDLSPNGEGVCTSHTPQGVVFCPRRITCRLVTAHAHAWFPTVRRGLRKSRGCRRHHDEAGRHGCAVCW
jgi:hypothetical protein